MPINDWFKAIFAGDGQVETVRLYPEEFKINKESSGPEAWRGAALALRAPRVSPVGGTDDFNDLNSAVYSGGNGYLALGGFSWLKEEYPAVPKETGPDDDVDFGLGADQVEEANEWPASPIIINDQANEAPEAVLEADGQPFAGEAEILPEDDIPAEQSNDPPAGETSAEEGGSGPTVVEIEKEEEAEVEIIEIEVEKEIEVKIENPGPEAENEAGGLSRRDFFKNFFRSPLARAQEYIADKIDRLEDFGEFKDATLNFSLAGIDTELFRFEAESVEVIDPEEYMGSIEVEEMTASTSELSLRGGVIAMAKQFRESNKRNDRVFIKQAKAQNSLLEDAKLAIWYSTGADPVPGDPEADSRAGERVWQLLDAISADEFSNALNGGYLRYDAPWLESWQDLRELEIKIEGLLPDDSGFTVFLDSVFIEASFVPGEELNRIKVLESWQDALELLSRRTNFKVDEAGQMTFRYRKKEARLWDGVKNLLGLSDFWSSVEIRAEIIDWQGRIVDLPLAMIFSEDGEFTVQLPELSDYLRPGRYSIRFLITDTSGKSKEDLVFEQPFSWGVLAMNVNKSRYLPLEEAYLQMAVLDSRGHTLCDAGLDMIITAPYGTKAYLSTYNGTITANPLCGPNNVIDEPDYYAYYQTAGEGFYQIELTASTSAGQYKIRDGFEVRNELDFEIERIGPTRIYPLADYGMEIIVKANIDFTGSIVETTPESFGLSNVECRMTNQENVESNTRHSIRRLADDIRNSEDLNILECQDVQLKAGDEININYTFDAPNVSPELFLLGPLSLRTSETSEAIPGSPRRSLSLTSRDDSLIFSEARRWQIASDDIVVATSTAGNHNGWTDPTYAWDNTNNTHASRPIVRSTGASPETGFYLESTANSVKNLGGKINSVEIGIEGWRQSTDITAYLLPRFNGTTNGTAQAITNLPTGADGDTTYYVDITSDGPGLSNWTWSDIINLDIRVYGGNSRNQDRTLYIDQIRIQVDYTPNTPPVSANLSASQKQDKSGAVDIYFQADDLDDDNLRARLEYSPDPSCQGTFYKMTIDTTDANATSSNNPDIEIDNDYPYQVGTSSGMINTSLGSNNISVDWLSKADTSNADGTYCLRLTLRDYDDDQAVPATTTVVVDNKPPTAPGNLSLVSAAKDSLTISFGASTTESHFAEYRIFYASTTPVGMNYYIDSSTDGNLGAQDFNKAATTTIGGLKEGTAYYVLIVAYDEYGYQASSSAVMMATNKAPLGHYSQSSPPAQRLADASGIVDISVAVGDGNNDELMAKVEYAESADCASGPFFPSSLAAGISATHGVPAIDNGNLYQISEITTPATNTLEFSWPTKVDLPYASSTYCLRLTLNDGQDDQNIAATATLMIDNFPPSPPGRLQAVDISTSSAYLVFGAPSIENNFDRYEIHYRPGASGVVLSDPEYSHPALGDIDYLSETQVYVSGLDPDTDYVFNIWAFDGYGHRSTSTEITFKTDASVRNISLSLLDGVAPNYIIAGGVPSREWTFRAVVKEEYGWTNLNEVVLRLANSEDSAAPYLDLAFKWSQATNLFSETGSDINGAVALSPNASSTCAADTCTLDFTLVFNHDFADPGTDYAAELYSTNDSAAYDHDIYPDIYQVRNISVRQIHYRWRYDDGGE